MRAASRSVSGTTCRVRLPCRLHVSPAFLDRQRSQPVQGRWASVDAASTNPQPPSIPPMPKTDLPVIGTSGDPFSTSAQQAYLDSEADRPKQKYYPDVPVRHRTHADEVQVRKKDPTQPDASWTAEHMEEFQKKLISFRDLQQNFDPLIFKAVTDRPFRFSVLSPAQSAILPLLPDLVDPESKKPRDLLVQAPINSGKKLAYLIPAIQQRLDNIRRFGNSSLVESGLNSNALLVNRAVRVFTRGHVGALIITPTREAATYIANTALKVAHFHDNFEVRLFVGGESRKTQMRDFMKGRRDIVVGTPGRLRDLLENENEMAKGISKTTMLIIDEAETLLDMGFRDDIDAIVAHIHKRPAFQTMMFTSEMSPSLGQIAKRLLQPNHLYIDTVVRDSKQMVDTIPQFHTVLPGPQHQIPHLLRLIAHDQLTNPGRSKILIFVQTTRMAQLFSTMVRALQHTLPSGRDTTVYEMHSKRSHEQRASTNRAFRDDKSGSAILVASDISARTADYPGCSRVIQLGVPSGTDWYAARVGKTGRTSGVQSRADLVLLPWEIGFLTWKLGEFDIKPCTVGQLAQDVSTLAQSYDEEPTKSFPETKQEFIRKGLDSRQVRSFISPVKDRIENIVDQYERLLPSIDELAVKETFASLLGYYIPKSGELRLVRPIIVQGCKDWAMGACGLEREPYVSDEFLRRLGMDDGRTSRFGQSWAPVEYGSPADAPYWAGRGRVAPRRTGEVPPGMPTWAGGVAPLDPNDPTQEPEAYRGTLYGGKTVVNLGGVKEAQALAAAKQARIAAGLPYDDLEPHLDVIEERPLFPREIARTRNESSDGPFQYDGVSQPGFGLPGATSQEPSGFDTSMDARQADTRPYGPPAASSQSPAQDRPYIPIHLRGANRTTDENAVEIGDDSASGSGDDYDGPFSRR